MAGPNLTERKPHSEAEELLPWYASGQLDEADRATVDAHLSSCAYCRQQLALERQLINEFHALAPEVESGWSRLRNRIEAPVPVRAARTRESGMFTEMWAFLARPAVAALATAQLAFVIVAGGVLLSLSQPAYRVLGSAPAPSSANIIVMFRADATELDLRNALEAAHASIVGGPTAANAYLLHVAPARRRAALAKLQSDDNVQLAQPIDGAGS